jgi:hypothetical protein
MDNEKSYKEQSREIWYNPNGKPTIEQLTFGCLQRIADAQEAMSNNYVKLLKDIEYLRNRNRELFADNERMARRISSLKGHITRMKKKKS